MNKEEILERIYKLKDIYDDGLIPQLHKHEVNPNLPKESRENYLYFTLPVCLNFQRSSPAMWSSALATYIDPKTNYLFYPEEVVKREFHEIQNDLLKHKLALQKNKHVQIWQTLSETLYNDYSSDPRKLIEEANSDVDTIIRLLQESDKKKFPYLRGPKMSNYWLFILNQFSDIQLKNLQNLSIIPDTHVIQCSVHLEIVGKNPKAEEVAKKWKELLLGTKLTTVELHPILWNWSRNKFIPSV
jgi:flagellar biosynthesis/type III secretory pathway chaperone